MLCPQPGTAFVFPTYCEVKKCLRSLLAITSSPKRCCSASLLPPPPCCRFRGLPKGDAPRGCVAELPQTRGHMETSRMERAVPFCWVSGSQADPEADPMAEMCPDGGH